MQGTKEDQLGSLVRDHLLSPSQKLKIMERRLFGMLVLSGLCHFTSSLQPRQYNFVNEYKTWLDARQYCRDKHTDLASINSDEDLDKLAALIMSGVSYAFTGLYRSWGWSLSNADAYKAGEKTYMTWTTGEPLEKQHHCGSMRETGLWAATDCSNKLNFSCYDESKAAPTDRFILVNSTMTWLAAQTYCRQRHTDLARVRNLLENEELQRMANDSQMWIWIGLTGTYWVWSDGSEASYTPWSPVQPSSQGPNDCAVLEFNSKPPGLIEGNCTEKLPFFCYTDAVKKHFVGLKLTADSSVNMTDPAVLESIMTWVESKLGDEGATTEVKVKWTKLPEKEEEPKEEQTEEIEEECEVSIF